MPDWTCVQKPERQESLALHRAPLAESCATHAPATLVKRALQTKPQEPLVQKELPLATTPQLRPHWPQLFTSVLMLISQPSAVLPLQLAKPALHWPMPQAPAVHTAAPLLIAPHELAAPLSTEPSQLLSRPSQTSVPGVTCPMQRPKAEPSALQVCEPARQIPMFAVPGGPL